MELTCTQDTVFGVADDELRAYMMSSSFVVPPFQVDRSSTCVPTTGIRCVGSKCPASSSGVSDFVFATTAWNAPRPVVVYPTLCLQLQLGKLHSVQLDPDVLQPQFWGFPNDRPPCSKPSLYNFWKNRLQLHVVLSRPSQFSCVYFYS